MENYATKKTGLFYFATGEAHSVKDFMIRCFRYVNLDWKKYLRINKKFFRPTKTSTLIGNIGKAKKVFKYKVNYKLNDLIKIMMDNELKK